MTCRRQRRRGISHESRNSPELSYHYGRDDRRHRIPDALDLGQARRQAEPRHRLQVAPGLDRRLPATARPRRPRLALPEEVFGVFEEGVSCFTPHCFGPIKTPLPAPGRFSLSAVIASAEAVGWAKAHRAVPTIFASA